MKTVNYSLNDNFKKYFWITEVIWDFVWWQKIVFIVKIWNQIQVIKLFKDYWKREIRELNIYKDYNHLEWIPKIIKVEDYNNDKVVFEKYIEWDTLENLKTCYIWNYELVKNIIVQIISILTPLWDAWIIHRDLNPKNIIINSSGKVNVIDFWIARDLNLESLTDTWFQPNTYKFASPEQILWKKDSISYRSDFFNLWIIAYYLLYWKLPFWNDKEEIISIFTSWSIEYNTNKDCRFKDFFEKVFTIDISLRPRSTRMLLNLLP